MFPLINIPLWLIAVYLVGTQFNISQDFGTEEENQNSFLTFVLHMLLAVGAIVLASAFLVWFLVDVVNGLRLLDDEIIWNAIAFISAFIITTGAIRVIWVIKVLAATRKPPSGDDK